MHIYSTTSHAHFYNHALLFKIMTIITTVLYANARVSPLWLLDCRALSKIILAETKRDLKLKCRANKWRWSAARCNRLHTGGSQGGTETHFEPPSWRPPRIFTSQDRERGVLLTKWMFKSSHCAPGDLPADMFTISYCRHSTFDVDKDKCIQSI